MTPRLSCTSYRKQYSSFRDGELPPERAAEVQWHLELCEPCRRRHHALEFGVRLLRGLDRAEPMVEREPQHLQSLRKR